MDRHSYLPEHKKRRRNEQESFSCKRCRQTINPEAHGTRHRNHCPWCLWSLHVDISPGDRQNPCQSLMEPIGVWVKSAGEWALIHRCTACGEMRSNRIAGDDNDWTLMALAARALANPPFPLESS